MRNGLVYNWRECVPVKIYSLGLLVKGKGILDRFSPGRIAEYYLKPAMKASHKLKVKIAKICLLATFS